MVDLVFKQPVRLEVPALEELDCAVLEIGADHVVVVLVRKPQMPTRFFNRRAAWLEAVTDRGVARHPGTLEAVASPSHRGGVRPDVLRFSLAGPRREPAQRRMDVRADAIVPVTVIGDDDVALQAQAYTLNVSGSGVLLGGGQHLPSAERLWLGLDLPDDWKIEASGLVVRATHDGQRAVSIDRIRPGDREAMIHFIFARQREELRRLRGG